MKAAKELQQRIDEAVGPAVRARMSVSNFHSFCQRILTEEAADAGLPPRPDVLDGVGQVLLLQDIWADLGLVYHYPSPWTLGDLVRFISRAKDELVTPDDFDRFVAGERGIFEDRFGAFEPVAVELQARGDLRPLKGHAGAYRWLRNHERAEARGEEPDYDPAWPEKLADREARRAVAGDGQAHYRNHFDEEDHPRIDALAASYVRDGAALEILRLAEMGRIYHAYEAELARRGALDFGEQIAAVTTLFKQRPNVLRRWQRRFRYLLVDEFQDANVAQIELIELLGRTPDRPDNVMVVGDDDQSIYRFRGASYAAFAEFDARFGRPPVHAPDAAPPGPPRRLRIEQNFRSVEHVLTAANRLIERNDLRFEPDKRLRTEREQGEPVELHVCAGAEDEAVAIVDAIVALTDGGRWRDVAILYRKHKHRDAIVARLRDEDIPYTVVGGLSLFETPEIRDLEQALRAIASPEEDAALVRMMTAGPWRLDATEILHVTRMASFDRSRLFPTVRRIVETGELEVDVREGDAEVLESRHRTDAVEPATRAKLRMLLGAIDELHPQTYREGPYTILERYLERTSQVLDLIAVDTLEAKRTVANLASFLRFAADWQAEHPAGTLAGFVAYLDAYRGAGGELPTSVELSEDIDGVRLMTLYQAKGLEYPIVVVPGLLEGEWPVKAQGDGWFPRELLREDVPAGDIHTDEERRLLYVAMTRAKERLILTTHGGPAAQKDPSRFIGELRDGAGEELRLVDRVDGGGGDGGDELDPADWTLPGAGAHDDLDGHDDAADALAAVRQVMPLPTSRERRLALRLRASELVSLLEATTTDDPEGDAAREALAADLAGVGRTAAMTADEARAAGLDPLTFRAIALDTAAGANLLQVAPLPGHFSYSALDVYGRCPLRYAFKYVYRMPEPPRPASALAFGSTAHEAFQAFTQARRERLAAGETPPTREDLERLFAERWIPAGYTDRAAEEQYRRRVGTLLDNFWTGELASVGEAIHEELPFELTLEPVRREPAGDVPRLDRPGGPPALGRDRGHRLQDRLRAEPEVRGREPPALDLRARLPRRAGPGHAGAGDAVLHGVGDAAVHDAHRRAAGRGPGGDAGPGGAGAVGCVHGDARRRVPLVRLSGDVPRAAVTSPEDRYVSWTTWLTT